MKFLPSQNKTAELVTWTSVGCARFCLVTAPAAKTSAATASSLRRSAAPRAATTKIGKPREAIPDWQRVRLVAFEINRPLAHGRFRARARW